MKKITGDEPKMWGDSIIGFGNMHLRYESGREVDWFKTGFSNRKDSITLYSMYGFTTQPELMQRLGKVKTGKGLLKNGRWHHLITIIPLQYLFRKILWHWNRFVMIFFWKNIKTKHFKYWTSIQPMKLLIL